MNTKPVAYSYIRFSSAEQAKGASLARQLELAEAYAKEHDLVLDDKLSFRDLGVSAYKKHNIEEGGDLKRFLDAVDEGLILPGSYLLVESLDRISRAHVSVAVELLLGIIRRKIIVVTLTDGMIFRPDDVENHFYPLIMSVVTFQRANEESETKSKRLRDAWARKRGQFKAHDGKLGIGPVKPITSVCPAWLKLSESEAEFEFIPEKRALVDDIIQMVMSGLGKRAIAKKLNEKGIPTISPPKARRSATGEVVGAVNPDRIWQESYITKVIKNRALLGEFQPYKTVGGKRVPGGDPIRDYFPRLVTDEEFALLQDVISERGTRSGGRRGRTFANLFTGLVKCGYCGSSMTYVDKGIDKRGKRDQSKNRFLVCTKAKQGRSNSCHYVPWTYSEFEAAFFKNASRSDFSTFITTTNDRGAELRALNNRFIADRAKLVQLKLEQQRCVDALKSATRPPQLLIDELNRLADEQSVLESSLAATETEIRSARAREVQTETALQALRSIYKDLQEKEGTDSYMYRARLNAHMRRVIRAITLYPGGTIYTPEKITFIRAEMLEGGIHAPEDVDMYIRTQFRTKPDKSQRFLTIKNGDEVFQILHPELDTPDVLAPLVRNAEALNRFLDLVHKELASRRGTGAKKT